MTDASTMTSASSDSKALGYAAGILMIAFAPAGLLLSYIDRGKASPLVASHYNYLISTFWKGFLFMVISLVLTFVLIGVFAYAITSIWYLFRCIKSIVYLHRGDAIANPSTWLV